MMIVSLGMFAWFLHGSACKHAKGWGGRRTPHGPQQALAHLGGQLWIIQVQ